MSKLDSIAEKNARVAARGEYMRWLAKRFGDLDLILTMQGEDRVSLRKVYVPLRVDTRDRSDESMGGPEAVAEEQLPGRDALEVIAEQPFVAISGRPGSGKTTLVQAIIGELTSDRPSEFRRRIVGERGILPIPLILRDYQDELRSVETLNDLLAHWWAKAEREARDKGFILDIHRLSTSFSRDADDIPLLLFFDGIDEVGGVETRHKLLRMAAAVPSSGYRAVVTGRPTGFSDIALDRLQVQTTRLKTTTSWRVPTAAQGLNTDQLDNWTLPFSRTTDTHVLRGAKKQAAAMRAREVYLLVSEAPQMNHLLPLAWPQIRDFIDRFFRLRQEWQVERDRLSAEFDGALSDPRRPHLLTLARRPIFLTLMALVHANDRRMPHGRADLYRRIVDLYLVRQTQQRRLSQTTQGEPMPHWDEREVRRTLGYLAWRSQQRGAEAKNAEERDGRQVIWTQEELERALADLLAGADPGPDPDPRPFADIKAADAGLLLRYFLHPTGLLVEPAEGQYQFAHLSFQEYLCAEYIHGRARSLGSRRFLDGVRDLLYRNLRFPAWDEVGLLLLCIHAAEGAQADRYAHLELLAELDPADLPQARLLIAALTGRELDYDPDELLRWLPVAAAVALVQPDAGLAGRFASVPAWAGPGLVLLRALFRAADPYEDLLERIHQAQPAGLGSEHWKHSGLHLSMRERWQQPPDDVGWGSDFGPDEARARALLNLANDSGWVPAEPGNESRVPLADGALEQALVLWLGRMPADGEAGVLYRRETDDETGVRLPVLTGAAWALDRLVPDRGPLWQALSARMPLDAWLIEGEAAGEDFIDVLSQPSVLLSLYPRGWVEPRIGLALGVYQALVLGECLSEGQAFAAYSLSLSLSLSRLLSLSGSRSLSLSRSRSLSRSLLLSLSRSRLRSWSRSLSRSLSRPRPLSLLQIKSLSPPVSAALERASELWDGLGDEAFDVVALALETFGYRFAALDWFAEQAADPDLMRRRGLRPGQPLPPDLGLFDAAGRIREQFQRESLVRLRAWLEDDDAVLGWFFPEGLSAEDDQDLREQIHILHHYQRSDGGHGQPWSPVAALDAVLADWPEDLPTREVTLAAAERDLLAVLNTVFPPGGG